MAKTTAKTKGKAKGNARGKAMGMSLHIGLNTVSAGGLRRLDRPARRLRVRRQRHGGHRQAAGHESRRRC